LKEAHVILRTRTVLVAVVVATALGLTGCSSGAPTASSSSGGTKSLSGIAQSKVIVTNAQKGLVQAKGDGDITPAGIQPFKVSNIPTPQPVPKKKYTVGIIECFPGGGCLSTGTAMAAVFKKFGWNVLVSAGDETPTKYQALMQDDLSQHVDAIATVAVPGSDISAQLAAAKTAGIVTIAVNALPADGAGYTGYLSTQENVQKAVLSSALIAKTDGKANVRFFGLVATDSLGVQQAITFTKAACPTCSTAVTNYNPPDYVNPVTIQADAGGIVAANPDTNYFVWPTAGLPLQPVIAAIGQAGRTSTLKLVSTDLDAPSMALVKSGDLADATALPYNWVGFAGVDAVLKALAHKPIPDAGSWGFGFALIDSTHQPSAATAPAIDSYVGAQFDYAKFYGKAWGISLSGIN
jgi:ABC-type sugar transport system substrate-binding protein